MKSARVSFIIVTAGLAIITGGLLSFAVLQDERSIVKTTIEKFMEKVCPEPNSGCWLWMGASTSNSTCNLEYGRFRYSGRVMGAHRVSYLLFNGPLVGREIVRHKCDNPYCVNPEHLIKGSYSDNRIDRNIRNHRDRLKKLSIENVRNIHIEYRGGILTKKLADKYGVSETTISSIVTGKTWKHVNPQ